MSTSIASGLSSAGARRDAGWREVSLPGPVRQQLDPGTRAFQKDAGDGGHLTVLVANESGPGWHLSISHRLNLVDGLGRHPAGRNPTWEEIRDARYLFIPDQVTVALFLPPRAEYVNLHDTTFHLYEVGLPRGRGPS